VTTLCRDCVALTIAAARNGRCGKCGSPRQVYHATLDRVSIAHVDCDAFDATVEERDRPGLADRPVIICGGFPWCRARLLIRCGALWRAFGDTDVQSSRGDAVAGEVPLRRRTHPHSASEAGQTSSPTAARPIPRPCSTRTRPARRFERAMDQIRGRYNWAAACLPPTMRRTL